LAKKVLLLKLLLLHLASRNRADLFIYLGRSAAARSCRRMVV